MKRIEFLKHNKDSDSRTKEEILDILKAFLNILKLKLIIKILELFD